MSGTNRRRNGRRRLLHVGCDRGRRRIIRRFDGTNDDLELYVCADAACTSGTNRTLKRAATSATTRRLRSRPTATRSSATSTGPTTIWSCTCARMRPARRAPTARSKRAARSAGTCRLRSGPRQPDHQPWTTPTTIWSCTCARMRPARRAPTARSKRAATSAGTRRLRSTRTATRSSATSTAPTAIWSCTCARDAACTSGTNRTLEIGGDVGWYTSVAIGANGNPVISHRDNTNDDLELYVCADATCTRHQPNARRERRRRQLHVGCDRGQRQPDHQPPRLDQRRFEAVRRSGNDLHHRLRVAIAASPACEQTRQPVWAFSWSRRGHRTSDLGLSGIV